MDMALVTNESGDLRIEGRFLRILRDGAIAFGLGLALALLAVLPDDWISQQQKFWAVLVLVVVSLIAISLRAFYGDLRQYLRIKHEISEFYEYSPRTLKLLKYERTYQLDPNGNADVVYSFELKNISDRNIPKIAMPISVDIYPNGDIVPFKVTGAKIGTHEILQFEKRCYEKRGILHLSDELKKQQGLIIVPFSDVNGLEPNKSREVEIKVRLAGAFKKMESGEYTTFNIYHPMESFRLVINPPSGYQIMLNPSDQFPRSIEIWDRASEIIDHREMATVPSPEIKGNCIEWIVKKPKIQYGYKVNYKTLKENDQPPH
jgi:hypothetical protein